MPITDPMGSKMTEPDITIEGVRLSFGQAMALRVAATNFMSEMGEPDALGDDEHGRSMAKGYRERLSEVLTLMIGDRKQ